MRFNDESETDYLDCVKFCADLVWHGGFFRTSRKPILEKKRES